MRLTATRPAFSCVILLTAASACADPDLQDDPYFDFYTTKFTVEDGGLTRTIEDPPSSPEQPLLEQLIESSESSEAGLLSEVVAATFNDVGEQLLVLDRQLRRLRSYRRDGDSYRLEWNVGREGSGPGEFRDPTAMFVRPEGDIGVWDGTLQRLSIFSGSGSFLDSRDLQFGRLEQPQFRLSRVLKKIVPVPGGLLVEIHSEPTEVAPDSQRGHIVRIAADDVPPDTLLTFPVPPVVAVHREGNGSSYSSWEEPPIFIPNLDWDLDVEGNLVFSPGGRYALYSADSDGTVLGRVEREVEPVPITRSDRLDWLRWMREVNPDGGGAPILILERLGRDRFASWSPLINQVIAGSDGSVWVERYLAGGRPPGHSGTWDVFGADSLDYRGSVQFDQGDQLIEVTDRLLVLSEDSMKVPQIKIFSSPFSLPYRADHSRSRATRRKH